MAAWSYSVMKDFRTCPRKYHAERVEKLYPFVRTDAVIYGEEVHKACEEFIGNDVPLPKGHKQFLPALEALKRKPGIKVCERKLAVNRKRDPTEYFARDVWVRGAADLIIINDAKAMVVDYKTGSAKYPDKDQLELMAMMVFEHYSDVQDVSAALVFLTQGVVEKAKYSREQLDKLWEKWDKRADILDAAFKADNWPPKTNGLCRKWCPVKTCEHNGG